MAGATVPLILDVDTGIDDALALALASADPRAEIVAVTTVAGNVDVHQATTNTLRVLDFLGRPEVAVHRGATKPLVREPRDARHFHGHDGMGEAALPASGRSAEHERGPAAIIRLARERPGDITLVCLGPLTNLAIALNVAPELARWLKRVVVMGGAFAVGGNVTAHAEFNIFGDPEAANEVFGHRSLRTTVLGLDVTGSVMLPNTVWREAATRAGAAARLVGAVCPWMETKHGLTGMFLHDPMAVAAALDASLVETVGRSVTVGCGLADRGETRAERSGQVEVAVRVDTERFLRAFCATLDLADPVGDQQLLTAI